MLARPFILRDVDGAPWSGAVLSAMEAMNTNAAISLWPMNLQWSSQRPTRETATGGASGVMPRLQLGQPAHQRPRPSGA
jgi:hypothetical protein